MMKKNILKRSGLIGLGLMALLLIISWGSSAYANDVTSSEVRINDDIQVDPHLLAAMTENGQAGYLIYFTDKADLSAAHTMDWETRGHYVVDTLRTVAEASQRNVRTYLASEGVDYKHFWIDNIVAVESSNMDTLNGLLVLPEIESIVAMPENYLIEPEATREGDLASILTPGTNIEQINAPDAWALGFRGQNTVIANIDTGVRHTHDALVNQYRGHLGGGTFDHDYNWLDPDGGTVIPTDTNGHGTHVMGTMVGDDGGDNEIGVAPESDWIACRGCLTSSCPSTALLACAEWIAAPYAIGDPGSADPDMRPMAVNNSWGSCQQSYDPWYQGVVDSWHAAGVFPIFANGNASNCGYSQPPGLNTVGNPARYGNVTGVGSSGNNNGMYAPHSNWGPTDNPDMVNPQPGWADLKPQVVAPGVSIRSSLNSGDSAYGSAGWTGTSMSAPHVAGLVALMWQAAPCLVGDYATTETILEMTATPILYDDLGSGARWPNYASGWGEIDALAAVVEAQASCGPFRLEATPSSIDACVPDDVAYTIDVLQNEVGFVDPVTLSALGVPAGYTPSFSENPVTPPDDTLLTLTGGAAASGSYDIDIVGESITATYTTTVGLNLFTAAPGSITLTDPIDGATGVDLRPTFSWDSVAQAATYYLEVATDVGFATIVYTATTDSTSYQASASLDPLTTYYWRVTGSNACGDGATSAAFSFTTRDIPPILVVDDDNNSPDVRDDYTDILDNLGLLYDVWDTGGTDDEPSAAELAPYSMVVWFTGSSFGGTAGPGAAGEAALGSWLENGNCLFISSQDYLFDRGLTAFMQDYLGVATFTNDVAQTTVTGDGSLFGGLGPYPLTYPFSNWSDRISPDATAELAFSGDQGDAAVNKDDGVYRTTFWGFPFEAMSAAAREETMQVMVDWCGAGTDTGTLAGTVTDADSGDPIAGANVDAGSRSTTTDASGDYSMTLPVGTYDVTASATNYLSQTVTSIDILTDTVTIQDFALQGSHLTYSPDFIEETMEIGDVVSNTVTVTNTGPLPIDWSVAIGNYAGPNAAVRVVPLTVTPLNNVETPAVADNRFSTAGSVATAAAPAPMALADVNLVLDDGTRENALGLTAGGQFIWLNRFTPDPADFPFSLTEVQILFGQGVGVNVGELVDIYIYEDTDGDGNPGTGANFLGSIPDAAVQAVDDVTFSVYPVAAPIALNGPGDVLIAVVNRTAGIAPGTFPAALDETASAGRSWLGTYTAGNPGDPPTLPADDLWGTADSFGFPGNWMVRGYGSFGAGGAWAAAVPDSGTIPADSVATFEVVFDASSLYETGTYTADLNFSGTFVNDPPAMPLTMTLDCATCGFLEGSITDDRTGDPLVANIHITGPGGFDVTLNGDSYSNIAVQPGSYTIEVSASGYFSDTAVAVVTQGDTTVTDFALVPEYGELVYSPAAIEEFMEVGDVVTNTVTVTNTGTVPFDFTVNIGNYDGPALQLQPVAISIPRFEGQLPESTTPPSTDRVPEVPDNITKAEPNPLAMLGEMAYGLDAFPGNNLVTFPDIDMPGSWSVIASVPQFHPAGDFLNGDFSKLYALDYDSNELVTIDTTTGARTIIGTALGNGTWTGLTGAVDGTLYASSSVCSTSSTLYTINPDTAVLTQIGSIGAGTCIIDIAINAQGELYGVDIISDSLYQIDTATGAGTVVGALGVDANFAQSMDFEEVSGILYWAAYTTSGELRVIDTTTGASALVGAFPGGAEVTGLALATSAGGAGGWAYPVPDSGTVPAGSSVTFDLVFDATSLLQVGTYTAELSFSGDFENSPPTMPLTMHLDCPTCGFLEGEITDDLTGDPLTADIHVSGSGGVDLTLTGDSYDVSVPAGTYTITVSADDYFSEMAMVSVAQGETVTTDFALTPIFSELVYAPDSFEVTVAMGTMLTETLLITNTGTASFDFSLSDVETGRPDAALLNSPAVVCPPDAFGYTCTDSTETDGLVTYDFEDISTTGTAVSLGDDAVSTALPIGFDFDYYGIEYSDIYISSNGFLTVLPGQPNGCCTGGELPSATTPNGVIAGWWEDLNPASGGTIHYQTMGQAPNRYLIIQFTDVPHFPNDFPVTHQYKLFEGSNNIEVHYMTSPSDGGTHSAGIENESGTIGLQYYLGTGSLPDDLAVCYLYPGQTACGSGGEDAIWLTQSPDSGTVEAGETFPVNMVFDTTVITQTGTYTAEVYFAGTFDNVVPSMTVVMHVEPPEANIDLTVTVGLDPDVCGTDDTLNVTPGTVVYYCYTVENTGNVVLPTHVISDTAFGHIDTFVYDLMPGEIESVMYPQTIGADVTSTARWTASHAGLGIMVMAEDAVTVTVTPETWYLYLPFVINQ